MEVSGSDRVIVENPAYVSNVSSILTSTDDRVVANYLGWRLSQTVMQLLNKDAREIRQEYRKAILGVKADQPRWKTCVEKVGFNAYTDK